MSVMNDSGNTDPIDISSSRNQLGLPKYTVDEWRAWIAKARMAARHKRCVEAERYYQSAMDVAQSCGEGHAQWWDTVLEWSDFLCTQGKHSQAEPILNKGWDCMEKQQNTPQEQRFAIAFRLASVLHAQAKYDQAEPFYYQALKDLQEFAGPNHPQTMMLLKQLAGLFFDQRRYERAEQVYLRTLTWIETTYGTLHKKRAEILDKLAEIMIMTERSGESERLRKESKLIRAARASKAKPTFTSAQA